MSLARKVKGTLRIGGMLKRLRDNTSGQYENGTKDRKIKGLGKSRGWENQGNGKIEGWGSRDKTLSSIRVQNQCTAARDTKRDKIKRQHQGIHEKGSTKGRF